METMLNYFWPGNVRELDHTVERAVLMAKDEVVRVSDLGLEPASGGSLQFEQMTLEQAECTLIEKTMSRVSGDISKTAKALGLSRSALYRRLEKYNIR
jgi:transcriptional regulator of acetoin/glycerol metabolism